MKFAAFLIAVMLAPLAELSAADAPKPNIVVIISDDQGRTDYGFMGHDSIQTPHLDKLAKGSVLPSGASSASGHGAIDAH